MVHRRSSVVAAALVTLCPAFGRGPIPNKPDPLRAPLAKAQAAFDAGRYVEALRQASALAAKAPDRWEGHRLAARAALALDGADRAEAEFRQALRTAPAALRPSLQSGLKESGLLRAALRQVAYARSLKASGDLAAAARAEESAYRTLPARTAFGLAAADLFESAGLPGEAVRLLEELRDGRPSLALDATLGQRLASLKARIAAAEKETAVKKEAEERVAAEARRAEETRKAETDRQAKEAEAKRIEDERRAEEERQKAERIRADREETDRLNGVLADQRRALGDSESAVRAAEDRAGDADRSARRLDDDADRARGRRDGAKRERDDLQDKLNEAKGDLSKQLLREQLRTAQGKYDDAKDDYDRAKRRYDDAKSRLDQARSEADSARRTLEQWRQSVRETEASIARIAAGG